MFHQVEGLAVDEGITLADLQGTLLTSSRGRSSAPSARRGCGPHFFPFTEPSVEVDVSCFACGGTGELAGRRALHALQGDRLDRDRRRRHGRPERVRLRRASNGYDPERVQGFAFGMGIERIAMLQARRPRPAPLLRERRALPGAVLDEGPVLPGCASTATPALDAEELAERLAMSGTEVERIARVGAALGRGLRRRPGARAPSSTPTPTGCSVCEVDAGDGERARSSAARPTSPPARPSPVALPGRA